MFQKLYLFQSPWKSHIILQSLELVVVHSIRTQHQKTYTDVIKQFRKLKSCRGSSLFSINKQQCMWYPADVLACLPHQNVKTSPPPKKNEAFFLFLVSLTATSHYMKQCWLRSLTPYGVTKSQSIDICCESLDLETCESIGLENMPCSLLTAVECSINTCAIYCKSAWPVTRGTVNVLVVYNVVTA